MANRQKEKSLETRAELRNSAIILFGQQGFIATTIADITRNAGYAKGNFYRYWKSKDDIFLTIMEERFKKYRQGRQEALAEAKTLEEVLDVILHFLGTIIDDGIWAKVFLEFTIHASGNNELRLELQKGIYRLSSDLFAEIFEPYKASDYPVRKIGGLVTALFEGYLIQSLLGMKVVEREDLMKAVITIIKTIK